MGLDTVELIMAIEREFDIDIPNDVGAKLESVGKIATYVQSRLSLDTRQQLEAPAAAEVWERVKGVVATQLGVAPGSITPDSHIVLDLGAD